MKNISSICAIFFIILFQQNIFSQQQGFGYIINKEVISLSGIEKSSQSNGSPVVNNSTIFGKRGKKNGSNHSKLFGTGVYSIYYDQGF